MSVVECLNKKKYLVVITAISLIILTIIINSYKSILDERTTMNTNTPFYIIENNDGTISIPQGFEGFRVDDTETQTIINFDTIYVPKDGRIVKNTVFHQINGIGEYQYRLIVMVDNVQTDFYVNGQQYSYYSYSLTDEEDISIHVETIIEYPYAQEIQYLVINDPYYNEIEYDNVGLYKSNLQSLSRFNYWRVRLTDNSNKVHNIQFETNYTITNEELQIRPVSLIENDRDINNMLMEIYVSRANHPASILLYNNYDYEAEYVVFMLLNWVQIPFSDGIMTKYFNIPPNTGIKYNINLPAVEENTPFHIFAFKNPYQYSLDNLQDPINATIRAIIKP